MSKKASKTVGAESMPSVEKEAQAAPQQHHEDVFTRGVGKVLDHTQENWRQVRTILIAAAVAIVLAIVAYGVVTAHGEAALDEVDTARTIPEMEAAAKEHPEDVGLLMRLGYAYARRSPEKADREKATEAFRKAADASDGVSRGIALAELGKIQYDLGRFEKALKNLEAAAGRSDSSDFIREEANWYAGRCLEELGRDEDARRKYEIITAAPRGRIWNYLAKYRLTQMQRRSFE
jgi:tetratricopeptide (TPR) repeat protein